MKKNCITLLFAVNRLLSGAPEPHCTFPIGKPAINFTAQAVTGQTVTKLNLADLNANYIVLMFYPKDFTFVCPTELRAMQEKIAEFKKRNVIVMGISVDDVETHKRWLATPVDKGGVADISFPLIADTTTEISRSYGVYDEKDKVAMRGLFILDNNKIIKSVCINENSLGRNIDEVLRILDALDKVKEHGEVCPANWHKGQPVLAPTREGLEKYLQKTRKKDRAAVAA